jgi:hypothetical protein
MRYESLDGQFRAGRAGGDQIFAVRTLAHAAIAAGDLRIGAELEDSRQELADGGTPLSTSEVNAAELLQAYLRWEAADLVGPGARSTLTIGRQTMDIGSRRLVARNAYRNTVNAFSGADLQVIAADGMQIRAFYLLPVKRLPDDAASLLDNDARFDEEDADVSFWGLYASSPKLPWGDAGEIFLFGLDDDSTSRDLHTVGVRLSRPKATGRFDYQIESAVQWGDSRATATGATRLDHLAHFQHAEVGYSSDLPWKPRLIAQFDYASGDHDPADDDNNRFDTLFGARRFDFGPSGIYGAFARSNLATPGWRLEIRPANAVSLVIAHRACWLASDRDAWTTAGVVDPSGRSGSFLGQQLEAWLQWQLIPGNVEIETGAARLFHGDFTDDAPNANAEGDTTYFYVQTTFSF